MAGVIEILEPVDAETGLPERTVEALDEAVLDRLAWTNRVQLNVVFGRPGGELLARESRAVVNDNLPGKPPLLAKLDEHADDASRRQREVHRDAHLLAAAVFEQVEGLKRPPVPQRVAHEVHQPTDIRVG